MYLSELRIYNYKSFIDSGPILFKPGINIVTGQNNAGKTALLEALSLRFQDKPHLGLLSETTAKSYFFNNSHVLFQVTATNEELHKKLPSQTDASTEIPISQKEVTEITSKNNIHSLQGSEIWKFISNQQNFKFDLIQSADLNSGPQPAYSFEMQGKEFGYHILNVTNSTQGPRFYITDIINPSTSTAQNRRKRMNKRFAGDVSQFFGDILRASIYSFRAERMKIGISSFGSESTLHSDASNLPEVLHVLQSTNPARFQRYNKLVKRVFSQVEWVGVRPVGNTQVEILVWPVSTETERADLAVPLSESGTGISQILAMLYVLATAENPRTILIDEPNSFLHPGAVRVLVEILREHPQHQYILSTHSPELIAASNPSTIHILRRSQGVTQIESVDTQEARHFRSLLMEVGSRPSDVFGAENVLWVEGPTEQLYFPLIARHFLRRPLAGVSIVGVLHTGDFDAKKDTRSVFRIYERLTQGSALLPPAIAFIFDREIRPDKDRQDLERQSKGKVHFLSRRTYENYLLHAGALATIMNEHPPFTDEPTNAVKIQTWLNEHCQQAKYYGKAQAQNYPQDIDAPKLLDALFGEFSENRLTYNKVEHSLALTEWLLAHSPEELKEIGELLGKVLPE